MGIGSNVVSELRRDPLSVDLILCLAAAACGTKFLDPAPNADQEALRAFFLTLPGTREMSSYSSDGELARAIGLAHFSILRFFIMANQSHLVHLPDNLKLQEAGQVKHQFLIAIASLEKEQRLSEFKKRHGKMYLWHGSTLNRWYSILHHGLIDLGGTSDAQNGAPGDGIYMSNDFMYSHAYTGSYLGGKVFGPCRYQHSALPAEFAVMALCENAKTPGLKLATLGEWTQKDTEACALRCLMIVDRSTEVRWDTVITPSKRVPLLKDVMGYFAAQQHQGRVT
jgi:hypothetical protein